MRHIFIFLLYITFVSTQVTTIEFDYSLFSSNGTLTAESLPTFLAQAYDEGKIHNKNFSNVERLNIHKLPVFTTLYTLQIFLVTSTSFTSAYIIKETKNGFLETQHLQSLMHHPGIKELIVPSIPPQGLPSLIIPFAYLSYCNQKNQIHYVTIMPAAKGIALSTLITQFRDNQSLDNAARLARAYNQLGYELGNFHRRFMMTHGDFHCSNIFYDEIENHCTFIDNETMAHSLENRTDGAHDIVRLFLDFFCIEANSRKNLIKGIDLVTWHNLTLKKFLEGYLNAYKVDERRQLLQKLRATFNTDYNFPWFKFKPLLLQQLREDYINPLFDQLF